MDTNTPYKIYINDKELGLNPVVKNRPYVTKDGISTIAQNILYTSQRSVKCWAKDLEGNSSDHYGEEARTVERETINNFCETIGENKRVRWISLGSGAGYHDLEIFKIFKKHSVNLIEYIPVDFSINMLLHLLEVFNESGLFSESDHKIIKAIKCDFHKLKEDSKILNIINGKSSDKEHTTLYSIFGRTFGNSNENKLLESLCSLMQNGDYLFIGANIICSEISAFATANKKNLEKFFGFSLKYIRHTLTSEQIKYLPLKNFMRRNNKVKFHDKPDEQIGKITHYALVGNNLKDDDIKNILITSLGLVPDVVGFATGTSKEMKLATKAVNVGIDLFSTKAKSRILVFGKSTSYREPFFSSIPATYNRLKYLKNVSNVNNKYICAAYKMER